MLEHFRNGALDIVVEILLLPSMYTLNCKKEKLPVSQKPNFSHNFALEKEFELLLSP